MLFTIGLLIATLSTSSNATLINGSFELQSNTNSQQAAGSTAITGWVTTLDGVEYFKPSDFGGQAAEGLWLIDLAFVSSSASGGIRQSFTTTPGQISRLQFSLGTQAGFGRTGTAKIVLMVDGADVQTYDLKNLTTNFIYEDFIFDFIPTAASTTIEFQNRQNANQHFAYLDNVVFQEIPEPGAGAIIVTGLLAWSVRRPVKTRQF
ncbi:MAG: DUF642 domain-containing protein [Planctomycetota bacterium]